jgi:acetylornithine deacetylase/succinyl-diaminopimelate desuccinylase-like protein
MSDLSAAFQYVDDNSEALIADYQRLVRQPSVSSSGEGVPACAALLVELMQAAGIDARAIPTAGQPIVFGAARSSNPDAPTLLHYSHYDVQPGDADDPLWDAPPFEARRFGDRIVGRGTTDAKGNVMAFVQAVKALNATSGLPINLKFIFDGEEESGSPSLPGFVEEHRELLDADAILGFDGGFRAGDKPHVSLGNSGLLTCQLRALGGAKDLHSARARLVPNAAWKLVWALNSLKGPDGQVNIDGFYDDVRPVSPRERELLEEAGFFDPDWHDDLGVERFLNDVTGVDALEQLLFTPTCNINGFASGFVGDGAKTLLPSTATVNMDFRLVMDQDPVDIFNKLRKHLDEHGCEDIELLERGFIEPSRTDADAPFARIVADAAREVLEREPALWPTGDASGRTTLWIATRLGIQGAGTGVGPPDWRGHAANEFMLVPYFLNGIKYAARIWDMVGERGGVEG